MAKLINVISFLVPLEFFIYKNINLQSITKSSTVICMTRNSSCYNIKISTGEQKSRVSIKFAYWLLLTNNIIEYRGTS